MTRWFARLSSKPFASGRKPTSPARWTAPRGAQVLRERYFALALIDGSLPSGSGIQLAEVAANENTPVILLSGHRDIGQTAAAFGVPHLPKPFSISELLLSSRDALAQARENVARVRASAAQLQACIEAVTATMADAHELLSRLNTSRSGV